MRKPMGNWGLLFTLTVVYVLIASDFHTEWRNGGTEEHIMTHHNGMAKKK